MQNHHSYTSLYYHLVWSTNGRQEFIYPEFREELYDYMGKIAIVKKWHLLAVGGTGNHIHLLLQINTLRTLSYVVSCLKANSSKFIREKFFSDFSWQAGYGVFSVDVTSLSRIKRYILNQEQHHSNMSYEKELDFLKMP
jgi:putative transposase